MQTTLRSFSRALVLAWALVPLACASAPTAPVTTPSPAAGAGPAEGGALPACPAGAVDGGECSQEGQHCNVAEGQGPLQCASGGHWVVTPPCCKK